MLVSASDSSNKRWRLREPTPRVSQQQRMRIPATEPETRPRSAHQNRSLELAPLEAPTSVLQSAAKSKVELRVHGRNEQTVPAQPPAPLFHGRIIDTCQGAHRFPSTRVHPARHQCIVPASPDNFHTS